MTAKASLLSTTTTTRVKAKPVVVDIGINLTHERLHKNWKQVVQQAVDAGVTQILLTGTTIETTRASLAMAREWYEDTGQTNLHATVGIHPYEAHTWNDDDDCGKCEGGEKTNSTLDEMRELIKHPLAVAVGECGLDYHTGDGSPERQMHVFRQQVHLAMENQMPMFLHEREAHADFCKVLDEVQEANPELELPPVVVHCFTGTKEEAMEYIARGFFIGLTGMLCKKDRGKHLRELVPSLPIERLMVETDAPHMAFKKGRRSSEPAHCIDVAKKLAEVLELPLEAVAATTSANSTAFFGLGFIVEHDENSKNELNKRT